MCTSSGETTVFMRHLVLVILKQVDSLKLQWRMSQNEGKHAAQIFPLFYSLSTIHACLTSNHSFYAISMRVFNYCTVNQIFLNVPSINYSNLL
jgi:hypothetical protein